MRKKTGLFRWTPNSLLITKNKLFRVSIKKSLPMINIIGIKLFDTFFFDLKVSDKHSQPKTPVRSNIEKDILL